MNHILTERSETMLSVVERDGNLVVDSRLIAEELGIEARVFNQTIKRYQTKLEQRLGSLSLEVINPPKGSKGGKPQTVYWLTEPQATFLMTLSRNTDEVVECKLQLVEAFEKAKQVIQQVIPAQSERMRMLELENENLKLQLAVAHAQREANESLRQLGEFNNAIAVMHGAPMLALIQGRPDAVVREEIEVEKVVLCNKSGKPIAISEGISKTSLAKHFKLKKPGDVVNWLYSVGKGDLLIKGFTTVPCEYVPRACLPELDKLWASRSGSRQRLLGEFIELRKTPPSTK